MLIEYVTMKNNKIYEAMRKEFFFLWENELKEFVNWDIIDDILIKYLFKDNEI